MSGFQSGYQPVDIANLALARLAVPSIALLTDNSVAARACNRLFNPCRDLLLGVQDWRFATRWGVMTASGTTPLFPWQYQFIRPLDCVKLRYVTVSSAQTYDMANDDRVPYQEGLDLVGNTSTLTPVVNTNITPAVAVYTAQVTNTALWDFDFVSLMSIQLAAEIALPVTGNANLAQAMRVAAQQAVAGLQPQGLNQGVSQIQRGSQTTAVR